MIDFSRKNVNIIFYFPKHHFFFEKFTEFLDIRADQVLLARDIIGGFFTELIPYIFFIEVRNLCVTCFICTLSSISHYLEQPLALSSAQDS